MTDVTPTDLNHHDSASVPPHDPNRGKWIPWIFVAMFGVIISVNSVMVYFAVTTWSGLSTTDSYRRGLAYDAELQRQAAQDALGWTVGLESSQPADGVLRVTLSIADSHERPLDGAVIQGEVRRPTVSGHDQPIVFTGLGDGVYAQEVALDMPGQWEIRLLVDHPAGAYRLSERVMVSE